MEFCAKLPQPTQDLLEDLRNAELRVTFLATFRHGPCSWGHVYRDLAEWLQRLTLPYIFPDTAECLVRSIFTLELLLQCL